MFTLWTTFHTVCVCADSLAVYMYLSGTFKQLKEMLCNSPMEELEGVRLWSFNKVFLLLVQRWYNFSKDFVLVCIRGSMLCKDELSCLSVCM